MKKKQLVATLVVLAFVICGVLIYIFYFNQETSLTKNTPRENKQVEIKAAENKDPTLCDQINGESYTFGPNDAEINLSEFEARQQCRDNIENNFIPPEFGG